MRRSDRQDDASEPRHFAIVTWRKTGDLRFLGHLDVARTIARAVRRAGLPVVYSKGFNPAAQISFSSALPLGTAGENELCAIRLTERLPADQVRRALAAELPPDLGVVDVAVATGGSRGLFAGLSVAHYRIDFWPEDATSLAGLGEAVSAVLAAPRLIITRQTKSGVRDVDIRPGLLALAVHEPTPGEPSAPSLVMALALEPERLVKPGEVLEAIARTMTDTTAAAALPRPRRVTRLGVY